MARQGDTSRIRAGPDGPTGYTAPAPEPSDEVKLLTQIRDSLAKS